MKTLLILLFVFLCTFGLKADECEVPSQIDAQEQFLPDNPGMSEFFYFYNDQKIVIGIDSSINSFWTPSEEQLAEAKPIRLGRSIRTGFNGLYIGSELHLIGIINAPLPSWTKNGNLWVKVNNNLFVDLDTGIVNEIGKHIFWEKLTPLREIPRTW